MLWVTWRKSYNVNRRVIPNVKAYNLFDEGKSPLEVTAELNLPGHRYSSST
jgi:hypothetical protein